jgi:hypothetical protein
MPEILGLRLYRPLARPRYRATMLAGVLSLSLTGVASAETPAAPNTIMSPAPVAEPLPATREQDVSQLRTDEESQAIVGLDEKVERAIRNATRVVGVDTTYLIVVAARESSFDPRKRADRTTATGLYQFTADTWLRLVRVFGARHGLGTYARQIVVNKYGAVSMPNAATLTKALRLRADPQFSALMAAELARDNKARLKRILGRPVTPAEIYIAHLLGVTQAARVIETAHSAPHTPGVGLLPAAARANPDVFNPRGRVASAGAIVSKIKSYYQRQELRFLPRISMKGFTPTPATTSTPDSLSGLSASGAASENVLFRATFVSTGDSVDRRRSVL